VNDSNHTLSPLTARLEALVNGDLTWLNDLDVQPIALVESAWRISSHPTVTLRAISVVLSGIKQGIWTLEAAHDWAYFVMHGGFPRHNPFNRSDLDIEYDPHYEELVAELVMRLERSQDEGQNPLTTKDLDSMAALVEQAGR